MPWYIQGERSQGRCQWRNQWTETDPILQSGMFLLLLCCTHQQTCKEEREFKWCTGRKSHGLLPNLIVVSPSKYGMCTCVLPYSTKFSRVFNFANFMNFQPFTKIFGTQHSFYTLTARVSLDNIQGPMLLNLQGTLSKEIPAFCWQLWAWVDDSVTEWCLLDKLYATPIAYYVCGVQVQWNSRNTKI